MFNFNEIDSITELISNHCVQNEEKFQLVKNCIFRIVADILILRRKRRKPIVKTLSSHFSQINSMHRVLKSNSHKIFCNQDFWWWAYILDHGDFKKGCLISAHNKFMKKINKKLKLECGDSNLGPSAFHSRLLPT